MKLAWALGPYRSLPICVDFEVLFDPGNVSVHVEYGPIVILLLHLTFAMMIVLVTLHAAIFWLTVAGYKTMGQSEVLE